jgi:CarD family transcriptional regulator
MSQKLDFKSGDRVVYPAHGVGQVSGIETQTIGGFDITVYVVAFEKDKMILRIPVNRATQSGLRRISSVVDIQKVRETLEARAKISRGMWSRRAKEYESKINSGNIVLVAEVVRDLHKNVDDPDRSYSERVIYESALNRLSSEYAAIQNVEQTKASDDLMKILSIRAANRNKKEAA